MNMPHPARQERTVPDKSREKTKKPPEKKSPLRKPREDEVVNMSFYMIKRDEGREPPFRRTKRDREEKPANDKESEYVDRLGEKFNGEEHKTEEKTEHSDNFVEAMAQRFGVTTEKMRRRKVLREIIEKIEPEIEFPMLSTSE